MGKDQPDLHERARRAEELERLNESYAYPLSFREFAGKDFGDFLQGKVISPLEAELARSETVTASPTTQSLVTYCVLYNSQ